MYDCEKRLNFISHSDGSNITDSDAPGKNAGIMTVKNAFMVTL